MASGAGKKARKQKETEAEEAPALSASATAARHLQNLRRKSEEPGASLAKEPAEQLGSKGLGRDSAFKKTMQAMCRRAG
ncbi:unnamed protein product [Durusdinium trenchii]|uniref:Uncharacterized protein n=1 Tax=Durusdinium trenchii TaxID=1381693 RepID=A0ABP0RTH0_9DINO